MSEFSALPKNFDSSAIEEKWQAHWQQHNLFDSTPQEGRENYCIMLPPPNVTGALHMGHAFQHALMDALIRRARMRGLNVLWQAGTDHAGIATQIVVTRELEARGIRAADLSREEFLKHAWEWKESSGGAITGQMQRLGASCDWSRERFTMDDRLSVIVGEVFVRLYEEGLIYRGKRLVNWDPVILTAVSDLEVVSSEEEGVMYYVRYPFVDNEDDDKTDGIVIGTTRPETILVDGAVAVHPDDPRYQKFIGKKVWVPLTEPRRAIEIIADAHVSPEFGTGCVKITGAHDFNDYEICKRHADKNIPIIILLTPQATMNENAPLAYRGLDRYVAREKIVADLDSEGFLQKCEPHQYKLPRGDRSGAVVEPMLTDQWFMNMEKMAAAGLVAAAEERVRFIPDNWRKVYDQWLGNIQDWCLSRQLLWGHRIPAWYDDEGKIYVARNEADAVKQAGGKTLRRDNDVLDTWFSSALWPFSTLDWPNTDNAHFRHYFPTSTLVTGFDIIFFWVARMVMMSEHLIGKSPFQDVYITGLVRDATGQKMSKSKGNILDPLDLIDGADLQSLLTKRTSGLMNPAQAEAIAAATRQQFANGIPAFGVDALRFTFASLASYGRDIKFDLERCAGYRNFCNKIWNAARFVLGVCQEPQKNNEDAQPSTKDLTNVTNNNIASSNTIAPLPEQWILSRLQHAIAAVDSALEIYRFDLAAAAVHHFLWNEYCDWYLEMAKLSLREGGEEQRRAQQTLAQVLEAAIRLTHPLMPFITEELWEKIAPLAGVPSALSVMQAPWPTVAEDKINATAETEMQQIMEVVETCRRLRGALGAPPQSRPALLFCGDAKKFAAIEKWVLPLCGASVSEWHQTLPSHLPQATCNHFPDGLQVALDLRTPVADDATLRARLQKRLEKSLAEAEAIEQVLSDKKFLARAPAEIVDKKRARQQSLTNDIRDIQQQLAIK